MISSTAAYEFVQLYARSLPSSSPEAREAAAQAISLALRLPTVFDFDPLFKLDAVVAAKDHELFPLLQIFLGGGLPEYRSWASSNAGAVEKYGTYISRNIQRDWLTMVVRFEPC